MMSIRKIAAGAYAIPRIPAIISRLPRQIDRKRKTIPKKSHKMANSSFILLLRMSIIISPIKTTLPRIEIY